MRITRLLALILALALSVCAPACADAYIEDIQVSAQALDLPAPTPFDDADHQIEVDLANQIVTVYRGEGRAAADIARQMICSSGTDTPIGTFAMPEIRKEDEREIWYYIGKFRLHVQWASRIVDDILFHSLPSEEQALSPTMDSVEALGAPASHGCIRLRPADSRWIAEHCPPGVQVSIFEGAEIDEELRRLLLISSFCREYMDYDRFLAGEVVLSISSDSEWVGMVQDKLIALGYSLGESNGFFGADTHRALTEWQMDNSLEPTGELDPAGYAALMASETIPGEYRYGRVANVKQSLTLRAEPRSKARALDNLRKNALVRIISEENGWYCVQYGARTGYVAAKYIQITENSTEVN